MPKVVFLSADGTQSGVDARAGDSVMVAATQNGISGIVAKCGGNMSCATCHVWVGDDFAELVGPPRDELEEDLLDLAVTERRPGSRLSCQITVTDELDGLTLEIPPDQP